MESTATSRWLAATIVLALAGSIGCDESTEREMDEAAREAGEAARATAEAAAAVTEEAARETREAIAGLRVEVGDWDADDDGEITRAEFGEWWDEERPFEDWDADADGHLTREEAAASARIERLGDWDVDGDGRVDEEEAADGLFDLWDADGDGVLDEEEWGGA